MELGGASETVLLVGGDEGGEDRCGGGEEGAGDPDDGQAEDDGGATRLGSQGPYYGLERILQSKQK